MAAVPLTWGDFAEWEAAGRGRLQPWLQDVLRKMSAGYLAELQNDDPAAPMPWSDFVTSTGNRSRVAGQLRGLIGAAKAFQAAAPPGPTKPTKRRSRKRAPAAG